MCYLVLVWIRGGGHWALLKCLFRRTAMSEQKTTELDVRRIPVWERHPRILTAFDHLEVGAELRITSDHEPRPLRSEFERARPGRYVWLQRMLSPDHWEVVLRRVPEPKLGHLRESLRRYSVFAGISEETVHLLEAAATERRFRHNDAIAEQGNDWDGFGILQHGVIAAIVGSALGREHVLFEVLAGDGFGEIATIDGGSMPLRFIVTSQWARVLCIPKSVIRPLLRADHELSHAFNNLCAQHMRVILERFVAQTSMSTVARVAATLLLHAPPQRGLSPILPSFQMTQGELAAVSGTVKEVVSRALSQLEEARAIERSGGHIVRVDREKLTEFASCS